MAGAECIREPKKRRVSALQGGDFDFKIFKGRRVNFLTLFRKNRERRVGHPETLRVEGSMRVSAQ